MSAPAARPNANAQIAKTIGTIIMFKMFLAIFSRKLGKSLEKHYID